MAVAVGAGCGGGGDGGGAAAPASSTSTTVAGAPRVLVVGDSLMFDAAPAIEAALRSTGSTVTTEAVLGLGLGAGPAPYDWRREWARLLAETRAQAVVVMIGGWDVADPGAGGPPVPPGTPEWEARYRGLLDEAAAVLQAGGARVYWLGLPLLAEEGSRPKVEALDRAVRDLAARRPGVVHVDAIAALAGPDGQFAAELPGPDGRPVRVRKGDGVHFCPDGAARLADAVARPLTADFGLVVGPGWEQGAWRVEERYSWAPGGGCG